MDGEAQPVETYADTVNTLLDELNINLNEGDVLSQVLPTRLTAGLVIRIDRARGVSLIVDGRARTFLTPLTNPAEILDSAGIELTDVDRVSVDGTEATLANLTRWPIPATSISIKHAVPIHIEDDDQTTTIYSALDTVGEALFDSGVTLYLADGVSPELSAAIEADMTVTIRRSQPLSVIVDGVTLESRSSGDTVADALADAGIALTGLDYAIPGDNAALRPGMFIRVIRVTEEVLVEQDAVPFEIVYMADPALELDQRDEVQQGRTGVQQRLVRVRYENGVEISREIEMDNMLVQEPINRVVNYGTQIVLRTVETPDGPRQYWRQLRMYATSYHPAALGGDSTTATGAQLTRGIIASDPDVIPYSAEIFVPGYGIGRMEDTGGPRQTPFWIDLGYDDENFQGWSRFVDVYFLTPVPANINYRLPE